MSRPTTSPRRDTTIVAVSESRPSSRRLSDGAASLPSSADSASSASARTRSRATISALLRARRPAGGPGEGDGQLPALDPGAAGGPGQLAAGRPGQGAAGQHVDRPGLDPVGAPDGPPYGRDQVGRDRLCVGPDLQRHRDGLAIVAVHREGGDAPRPYRWRGLLDGLLDVLGIEVPPAQDDQILEAPGDEQLA